MTAKKKKKRQSSASSTRPGRRRVAISFKDSKRITRSSFKAECDINRIVDQFTRTGIVPHVQRATPQYGDAPEQDLFEAACIAAEIRSKEEEGHTFDVEEKEPENGSEDVSGDVPEETSEKEPEAPELAAEDESSG